jgi:hypothetical protein
MAKAKAVSFNLLTEGKDLNALIKSIGNRGKLLDRDLHIAGVSALYHAYTHGSTAFAQQLVEALGSSARKGALKKWLFHFGCFMVKEDNKTFGIDKELKAKGFDAVSKDAIATPFWELTADKDELEFVNAMEGVKSLINRLTKAKANGKLRPEDEVILDKLAMVAPSINSGIADVPV